MSCKRFGYDFAIDPDISLLLYEPLLKLPHRLIALRAQHTALPAAPAPCVGLTARPAARQAGDGAGDRHRVGVGGRRRPPGDRGPAGRLLRVGR